LNRSKLIQTDKKPNKTERNRFISVLRALEPIGSVQFFDSIPK